MALNSGLGEGISISKSHGIQVEVGKWRLLAPRISGQALINSWVIVSHSGAVVEIFMSWIHGFAPNVGAHMAHFRGAAPFALLWGERSLVLSLPEPAKKLSA